MNPEIFNMLFNPQTLAGPGFGQLLASNPDQAATALAQAGIEPPDLSGGGETEMPFAPSGGDPLAGAAPGASGGFDPAAIAQMLSGLKAPAAPTPQKVGTPGLPTTPAIPAAPIAALLQMMQPEAPRTPQAYRLNQAIGGR